MKVSKYSLYRRLMFALSNHTDLSRAVKAMCENLVEASTEVPTDEHKDLLGLFEDKASKVVDLSYMRYKQAFNVNYDSDDDREEFVGKAFKTFVECSTRFLRTAEVWLDPEGFTCVNERKRVKLYSSIYKNSWNKHVKNMK